MSKVVVLGSSTKMDPAALRPFLSAPWAVKLLQDPAYTIQEAPGRLAKDTGGDELIAVTLNNPRAIAGMVELYKEPPASSGAPAMVDEILTLFSLQNGVAGYPGTLHGGIVATILDEAIGDVLVVNMLRGALPRKKAVTAYLNTTFVKPVPVPGVVLCRSRIVKRDGRKFFLGAEIVDGDGTVLSRGDALYISVDAKI